MAALIWLGVQVGLAAASWSENTCRAWAVNWKLELGLYASATETPVAAALRPLRYRVVPVRTGAAIPWLPMPPLAAASVTKPPSMTLPGPVGLTFWNAERATLPSPVDTVP